MPSRPGSILTPTGMSQPPVPSSEEAAPKSLPSIREFFAFFIDQPQCFIRFLETIAWRRWNEKMWEEKRDPDSFVHVSSVNAPREVETTMEPSDEEDREAVWGTLLELYLAISAEAVEGRERMRSRALSLLSKGAEGSKLRYEPTQALIVCLTHDFVPGIVLLYDRLGMVEDILRFWFERAEDDEDEADEAQARIFETLEKYGDQHPELYPIALRYLASSSSTVPRHLHADDDEQQSGLEKALAEIDSRKILSPIEVIEILSKPGSCASIGTVKKYLLNQVLNQKHQINSVHPPLFLFVSHYPLILCSLFFFFG